MRVAVTGGAGFIGHHLVAALLRRGHQVTVLDTLRRGSFGRPAFGGIRCLHADVRDRDDLRDGLAGADVVVHLAAQANVMGSEADRDYALETNVTGTWNVAEEAASAGVPHLVFASSREVYGEPGALPVREDAPIAPRNLYGATKAAAEALLATPRHGMAVSVLRLANVIGPGDSCRVVPLWLEAARRGQPLAIFGGTQLIDFVPVPVVVEAFTRLVEHGPVEGPVNVGSGTVTSLSELASRVLAVTGSLAPTMLMPARPVEVTRFQADTTRMCAVLGIDPPADPLAYIEASW